MIGTRLGAVSSQPWKDVTPPAGWTWTLPFTIQKRGRRFRCRKDGAAFDLLTHAAIPAGVTYYVSTTGNDGNTGLDWDHALRNVYTAVAKADANKVYIGAGYYYRNQSCAGVGAARSMAIIGVGDVYLTSDCYNQLTSGWTPVDNHYTATIARTVVDVYDSSILSSYGHDSILTKKTSIAEVDAAAGSWWLNAGTLYVRTADDRAPDTSLRLYESGTCASLYAPGADLTQYWENLKIRGGWGSGILYTATAGRVIKGYLKNCSMRYASNGSTTYNAFSVWGATEFIAQSCELAHSLLYDGFNYKVSGGTIPKAIEIDCESYDHGDGSTDQPSTSHDGVQIVRINGKYHDCRGSTILADVGNAAGKSWNLGCELYNPAAAGHGAYVDSGVNMWLDSCTIHDVPGYALQVPDALSAIRYRNLASSGNFQNNGGTLETY